MKALKEKVMANLKDVMHGSEESDEAFLRTQTIDVAAQEDSFLPYFSNH